MNLQSGENGGDYKGKNEKNSNQQQNKNWGQMMETMCKQNHTIPRNNTRINSLNLGNI